MPQDPSGEVVRPLERGMTVEDGARVLVDELGGGATLHFPGVECDSLHPVQSSAVEPQRPYLLQQEYPSGLANP